MGKHTRPSARRGLLVGPREQAQKDEKYQDQLDWHEKIITGERQEKNPDTPTVWPFPSNMGVTQD